MNNRTILLVEDEQLHRLTLQDNLEDAGYQVYCAENGQQALDLIAKHSFPVALFDIKLPDISGIELQHELQSRQPDCNIILMTGQSSVEAAVVAMRDGAYDYLAKPFKVDLLLLRIERAFQLQTLRKQLIECSSGQALSSNSPKFQQVVHSCKVAAQTQATVLLLGESGVGKERLADFIHRSSPRAAAPMIRVNCAAIPEALLEGEMFGYRKGAFTGAQRDHDGLLLQADGGTLFLDEIGEIPLTMQVKLLRVLQEKKLRRLGEDRERNVDFRLVAATHQDLAQLVKEGRVREDFYYRLNVIPVQIPPLRERREDIAALLSEFINFFARQNDQAPIVLSPETFASLENYPFPGNIRELRNLLERLQVLYAGQEVGPDKLPPEIVAAKATGSELIQGFRTDVSLKEAVRKFEAKFIRAVLVEERDNKSAAAERLGISRKTLWEKLSRE